MVRARNQGHSLAWIRRSPNRAAGQKLRMHFEDTAILQQKNNVHACALDGTGCTALRDYAEVSLIIQQGIFTETAAFFALKTANFPRL